MFGLALRSYQRKVARLRESSTVRGQSLWEAVLDFLTTRGVATRAEVLRHFHADPEDLVTGVLYDLAESGVIFSAGRGVGTLYRAISTDELSRVARDDDSGIDAMVWVIVYRSGPIGRDAPPGAAHDRRGPRLRHARRGGVRADGRLHAWVNAPAHRGLLSGPSHPPAVPSPEARPRSSEWRASTLTSPSDSTVIDGTSAPRLLRPARSGSTSGTRAERFLHRTGRVRLETPGARPQLAPSREPSPSVRSM